GALAEYVRTMSGAVRSSHPQTSFAAVGAEAASLMARHPNSSHLGPESPLGALYRRGAMVLLLGVGYEVCTVFHLAEYLYAELPKRGYRARGSAAAPGSDGWLDFEDIDCDDDDFRLLGKEFEVEFAITARPAGRAPSRLFPAKDAVDFAVGWMRRERR
ncbi:MAG: AAC(3) family N-acetyltransferase, partial [Actinocrinis sp.]